MYYNMIMHLNFKHLNTDNFYCIDLKSFCNGDDDKVNDSNIMYRSSEFP